MTDQSWRSQWITERNTIAQVSKNSRSRFLQLVFLRVRFVAKRCILEQKHPKGQNRNLTARNTLVQGLALYTDPESHNAQSYRRTYWRTTWWCQQPIILSRPALSATKLLRTESTFQRCIEYYRLRWYCCNQNTVNESQGCRALTFALARLSCQSFCSCVAINASIVIRFSRIWANDNIFRRLIFYAPQLGGSIHTGALWRREWSTVEWV